MNAHVFIESLEEVPLLTIDNVQAGLVNVDVEITPDENGQWTVGAILLEGFRPGRPEELRRWYRQMIAIEDREGWLYRAIHTAVMQGRCKDQIDARVEETLDEAGLVPRRRVREG
jgi:hypothetical protein